MTVSKRAAAPKRIDGRTRRAMAIKARILRTCRQLMRCGNLQPAAAIVAKAANVSTRTVFTHFGSIEKLRCLALEDEGTRAVITALVIGPEAAAALSIGTRNRLLHAVALGSVPGKHSRRS